MSRRYGDFFLLAVLVLLALGMVMLASTSAFGALAKSDDPYFDVRRQFFWLSSGLAVMVGTSLLHYRWLSEAVWGLYILSLMLLIACFLPGVGMEINGERRWIQFMGKSFQPSEFAKIAVVIVIAYWFALGPGKRKGPIRGFFLPALCAGVPLALIAGEVDLGTTFVLGVTLFLLFYIAGAAKVWLGLGLVAGIAGMATLVWMVPGRWERVLALFQPEAYAEGVAWQQQVAQLALGSGGLEGVGLGAGRMKMHYLPFAHTDFIFPMVGEELGLVASVGVVLCFAMFVLMGMAISMRATSEFGRLLGSGLVLVVGIQAILNMAVTTGLFPNTGLPLPFVSYGGSNLICSLFAVGVVLSIHRQTRIQQGLGEVPGKQEPVTAGL